MKKILLCLFICLMSSTGFAASLPQSIAFEFQEHGKFTGIIGKAYVTETAVEVVTFAQQSGEVVPFAFIYTILGKSKVPGNRNKGLILSAFLPRASVSRRGS